MKPSQKAAVEYFRRFLQENLRTHDVNDYGAEITRFEIKPTEYGTYWITATTEFTGLPGNSVLRAMSHEHWHVEIGPRGSIGVYSCPKSMRQFRSHPNGRAFNMNFTKYVGK